MITGLLKLRMEDYVFKTNLFLFHARILITKLRMVQPVGILKMKVIKNTRRRTVNTSLSARQER